MRTGTVLRNSPMTFSVSFCQRPATGQPMTKSSCPEYRINSVANPASSAVNSVAPACRLISLNLSRVLELMVT